MREAWKAGGDGVAARYEGDDGAGGDGKDVGSKEGFSTGTGKGGGFEVTGGNGRTFLSCGCAPGNVGTPPGRISIPSDRTTTSPTSPMMETFRLNERSRDWRCASERMLIILPYDHSRLSVLHKGSKHHGAKTREYIHSCSILDRTQWLAARMPQHQATVFRAFEGKLRRASFAPNSKPAEYSAMTTALRGVITSHLHEVSIQVPFSQGLPPIIRSPKTVALNARLVAARVFLEQLEKMGSLDSESSVDDGTSEDEQCF